MAYGYRQAAKKAVMAVKMAKKQGGQKTMKKYRISFYTGPSVYDALLFREYVTAKNTVEAEDIAKSKCCPWYEIIEVRE